MTFFSEVLSAMASRITSIILKVYSSSMVLFFNVMKYKKHSYKHIVKVSIAVQKTLSALTSFANQNVQANEQQFACGVFSPSDIHTNSKHI